jgi:hypothetical protein
MNRPDYTNLDNAICRFLAIKDGHPTNNSILLDLAGTYTLGGSAWRLIDRRMTAMRRQGRIKFVGNGKGNPSGKTHGWVVCISDSARGTH